MYQRKMSNSIYFFLSFFYLNSEKAMQLMDQAGAGVNIIAFFSCMSFFFSFEKSKFAIRFILVSFYFLILLKHIV